MTPFTLITFLALSYASATFPPHSLNTNVACGYFTDCVIDCSNANNHIACAGQQIDGSDAKSLTVICDSSNYLGESDKYSGCKDTQITCPYNAEHGSDSKCTILCSNPNDEAVVNGTRPSGCEGTFISTYTNRKLNYLQVTCTGTQACKGLNVYAPSWQKSNTNIQCNTHSDEYGDSENACTDVVVHGAYFDSVDNWLDLRCEEDQCDGLEVRCGENGIGTKKTISKMVYNEDTKEYECDDDKCCPLSTNAEETTTTEAAGVLRGVSSNDEERSEISGEMIALIVVSLLLLMMCAVSGCLVLKLQKEKQPNETGAMFVQLAA